VNDRPWPSPRYKAGYRALFLALTLWDIRTTIAGGSLWWVSVALTVFQVGIPALRPLGGREGDPTVP
jgi:hypothetical protein